MAQKTMYSGLVNSPETTITNNVGVSDTLIYVLDPARVPPDLPNLMTIGTGTNAETVLVESINDSAITVQRGFQGVAKDWPAGAIIARNFTAYDHDTFKDNIEDLDDSLADLAGTGRTTETVKGNADDLAAHLAETVTGIINVVTAFGAKGDDTDDTLTISNAIDAVIAAGGGELYFPKGIYNISSIIEKDLEGKLIKLRGSVGTIIKAVKQDELEVNREHMIKLTNASSGIIVEGLTFDCNHVTSQGLWVQNASENINNVGDVIVDNCRFKNGKQTDDTFYYSAGLVVRGAFERVIVTRSFCDNFYSTKASEAIVRGIQVTQDSDLVNWIKHTIIRDTEFKRIYNDTAINSEGLAVYAPQTAPLSAVDAALTVEGCTFVNCKGRSIKSQVQHNMISGNKFYRDAYEGNTEVDLQYGGGIVSNNEFYFENYATTYVIGGSMYNTPLKGLVFTGNRLTYTDMIESSFAPFSVVANDVSSVIRGVTIADNHVIGEVQHFASFRLSSAGMNRAVITGNSVTTLKDAFIRLWKNGSGYPKLKATISDNHHYSEPKDFVFEDQLTQLVTVNVGGNTGLRNPRFNRVVLTGLDQGNVELTINIPLDYNRRVFKVRAGMAYSSTDATIQAAVYEAFVVMNHSTIVEYNKIETPSAMLGSWTVEFANTTSFNVKKLAGSAASTCDWWIVVEGGGVYDV